jgi:hypothetical protein
LGRDRKERETSLRTTIHHQLKLAREGRATHDHLIDPLYNNGNVDFTTHNWVFPSTLFKQGYSALLDDCPLLRLAHNVTQMPQGDGRRILTVAVEHARANNHWNVKLSELSTYVSQFNLVCSPLSAVNNGDEVARTNFLAIYKMAHP